MNNKKQQYFGWFLMVFLVAGWGMMAEAKSPQGELTGVVNINEASLAQLTLLPGVGPKKAQAIQSYAKAHPFKTVEELQKVKGFGDKALIKLKPYLTVSGSTTAKRVPKTAKLVVQ